MKNKIDFAKYYLRSIDDELERWSKNNPNKTIALINGARRTGKTYSLEYLGQKHFDNYEIISVIDLDDNEISLLTNKTNRIANFCDYLLANFNIVKEQINNRLLIVFDEIQEHNELKETISFLNKHLECRFACTGSALWINDTKGTRPTPDYEPFKVYPFSFPQFLKIVGEGIDVFSEEKLLMKAKKDKAANKELQRLLRLYIAIGGMPQPINCYLEHINDGNKFFEVNRCKKISIINTYENDLRRYQQQFNLNLLGEYKNIVRRIGIVKDIAGIRETFDKLEDMNIVILLKNLNEVNKKLSSSINETSVKPFLLDTGILFYYFCDSDNEDIVNSFYEDFVSGKDTDNNGYLFENYVASALIQNGLTPFFKTFSEIDEKGNSESYELDFVFSGFGGPIVIEAKTGSDKTHKSLNIGLKKYSKIKQSFILSKCYKFDKQNIQKGPHYIPFYALDYLVR